MNYLEMMNLMEEVVNEILLKAGIDELVEIKNTILEKYKKEIKEFNLAKESYEEIKKYGKYAPDYKKILNKLSVTKANLYKNIEVKKYFELENKIKKETEDFLKEFLEIISPIDKGGTCRG